SDDARARRFVAVHAECRELRQLEKGRAGIEQQLHPVARQQLAARRVLLARFFAAAFGDLGDLDLQVADQRTHRVGGDAKLIGTRIELALEDGHGDLTRTSGTAMVAKAEPSHAERYFSATSK